MERSFIADLSWRGRRTLGLVHLTNGDVKWAFDRPAGPKPIDWLDICRRASADADQRRKGERNGAAGPPRKPIGIPFLQHE